MPAWMPLPRMIRSRPWLAGAIGVILVLCLLVAGARLWIGTDSGRAFVEAQIDGRKAGRVGTIDIDGLSGDPLDDLQINRLTLTDSEGIWLEANNVRLAWSPMALISRKLDLNLVSAERIRVIRRPLPGPPSEPGSSSGSWSVTLADLRIDELILEEGVAGQKAAFQAHGQLRLPEDRTLTVSLVAEPLEGAGDSIDIQFKRRSSGSVDLEAEIEAPEGGALATLAGLAEGESASLEARASGTVEEGDGFAVLKISGETAAEVTTKITSGNLLASANVDSTRLPLPDTVKDLAGPAAVLKLTADIGDRRTPFKLDADIATGQLTATGTYRTRKRDFDGPVEVAFDFYGLKDLAGLEAALAFEGTVTSPLDAPSLDGTAALTANSGSSLPFRTLEGPVQASSGEGLIGFEASLTGRGVFPDSATARRIAGETPTIDISGRYDRARGRLELSPSTVELARGRLTARGIVDTRGKELDLSGRIENVSGLLRSTPQLGASGDVAVRGTFGAPRLVADLRPNGVEALNGMLARIVSDTPQVRANITWTDGTYRLQQVSVEGGVLRATGSGSYAPDGQVSITGGFTQSGSVELSGTVIDLSSGNFAVRGRGGIDTVSLTSGGGQLSRSGIDVTGLETDLELNHGENRWSGPVELTGTIDDTATEVSADLSWSDGVFALQDIDGSYQTVDLAGALTYGPDSALDAGFNVSGERFDYGNRHIGQFNLDITLDRAEEDGLSVEAAGTINDVWISQGLRFDTVSGEVRNAPEGYNFSVQILRDHDKRPTRLALLGSASFGDGYPTGQVDLEGTLLGEPVETQSPITWRLGDEPAIDVNLSVLGGKIEADVEEQGDDPRLTFRIRRVSLAPVFATVGLAAPDAVISGGGDVYLFGEDPHGEFVIAAEGPLPGVEETFALDLTGRLGNGQLVMHEISSYGGELRMVADLSVPIDAKPGGIAQPSRTRPLKGTTVINGNLSALRSVALAYGHDIGGTVDGKAVLSGTIEKPVFEANMTVSDGIYEFGTTGLRLTDLDLEAAYRDLALVLDGEARGAEGGSAEFAGSLSRKNSDLTVSFTDLLLYDRDTDSMRAGGEVTLTGDGQSREVTGEINVASARFSLENLPSSRPQAIEVRWEEDGDDEEEGSALRQSLSLDLDINADRRVYLGGRGLESEWGLDLTLTGTPASPRLDGQAMLKRGTLDLAGRPFVFDQGTVTFNGPVDRARLDVQAERTVNGFEARVALTGSPTEPSFELSSSPELPEDEILSRLLFGRSSVDLSALEAAQLANSIARLSGRGTGFDPTSELQAALGVDRLSFGTTAEGSAQVGVGQYLAEDVYLELNSAGASGSSVEVEWEPRPQISVTSESKTNGEARVSIKWKRDY